MRKRNLAGVVHWVKLGGVACEGYKQDAKIVSKTERKKESRPTVVTSHRIIVSKGQILVG